MRGPGRAMSNHVIDATSIQEADEARLALPSISVITPAFNEARYLPQTLERLRIAERHLTTRADAMVEVVVVDNASTDRTAECARTGGATVVLEPEHNIAKVRNAGATVAQHDVLVFLDADTLIPADLLLRIALAMHDPACVGGAVDAVYKAADPLVRTYLGLWRGLGLLGGMAQGACHFCSRRVFRDLGGYDETVYMGEDVDFYWRMKRAARRGGLRTCFVRDAQVVTSSRRFDHWPLWRTLIWTNPLIVFLLRRRRGVWGGWYKEVPR